MVFYSIANILALILIIVGAYVIVKNAWYWQALTVISGLAGFICGIAGVAMLTDSADPNDMAGTILLGIGILSLLAVAALVKLLPRNRTTDK